MNSKLIIFLFAIVFCASTTISASAEKLLTIEDLLREAINSNKDLLETKTQIDAAKARLLQSGRLSNPEIEYAQTNDSAFNNAGEFSTTVALIQKLPVNGRISKEIKLAKIDLELSKLEVSENSRIILKEVAQTARSLLVQRRKVKTLIDVEAQFSKLVQTSEKRFKAAEVSEIDINLSRAEQNKVSIQLSLARAEEKNIEITLLGLLGRTPEQDIENFSDSALDNPVTLRILSQKSLLDIRPDYLAASQSVSKAKADEALAKSERFQDISVGIEYSRDRSVFVTPIGNKQDDFLGIRLSVPLPLWNQNEGKIAEAQADANKSELKKQAIELKVAEEASQSQNNLETLIKIQKLYKTETLPLIENNLQLSRKSYEQGLIGASSVIQSLEQYLDAKLGFLSSMAAFANALTQYEFISATHIQFLYSQDTKK